jgi:hypothetical protein
MKTALLTLKMNLILSAFLAAASTGVAAEESKATVAVTSLADIKASVQQLSGQIGVTVAALQRVKAAAEDAPALAKAYENFSEQFTTLEKMQATTREQGTAAKARAQEHYDAWQKDMVSLQNADVREKAQKRFTQTKKDFDKIVKLADEAKTELSPFFADLKDIKVYLASDLTKQSVNSLSGTIWKIGNRMSGVQGHLDDVVKQIDKTLEKMPKK